MGVDIKSKQIHYADSLYSETSVPIYYARIVLEFLADEATRLDVPFHYTEWKFIYHNVNTVSPRQTDGYNCGCFCVLWADFFTRGLPTTTESYGHTDMIAFRNHYASILWNEPQSEDVVVL